MIRIISCITSNGVIGKDNDLVVKIKEDLRRFKEITTGKIIVMGRGTWESLPTKPLPNRRNIVLTSKKREIEGAEVFNSKDDILELAKSEDIYIIGGESLYREFLDDATELLLTEVGGYYEGDRFFPEFDVNNYNVVAMEDFEETYFTGTFKTYRRIDR